MVKLPVIATLVTEDPVIDPTIAEEITAILAFARAGGHHQPAENREQDQQRDENIPDRPPKPIGGEVEHVDQHIDAGAAMSHAAGDQVP